MGGGGLNTQNPPGYATEYSILVGGTQNKTWKSNNKQNVLFSRTSTASAANSRARLLIRPHYNTFIHNTFVYERVRYYRHCTRLRPKNRI